MCLPHHKDKDPSETIDLSRNILKALGIFFTERWSEFSDNRFSVRISDMNIPSIGTNGKGCTRSYALASAYGEFMERLQNMFLLNGNYGLIKQTPFVYPDGRFLKIDGLLERHNFPILFEHLGELNNQSSAIQCYPFYNVNDKKVDYLPLHLINSYCFSTGCVAGNTPEEAIVQGLCEIFERFVVRKIFYEEIALPTIPFSLVKGLPVERLIQEFLDRGFHIIIKDCTLGGTYPVVGIILFNNDRTHYRAKVGSDPLFEIALLRCLDEICQGYDADEFEQSLLPIDKPPEYPEEQLSYEEIYSEYLNFTRTGRGQLPHRIFLSREKTNSISSVFNDKFTSHRHLLKRLTKIILDQGYTIFVRDVSFLGFPAYRIYIPNISERLSSLSIKEFNYLSKVPTLFRKCLLRIADATDEDLIQLADYLKFKVDLNYDKASNIYHMITNVFMNEESDLVKIDPHILLAALYIITGDYTKALENLEYCNLEAERTTVPKSLLDKYYSCLLAALKFKIDGLPESFIISSLKEHYGDIITPVVIDYLNNPRKLLRQLEFPYCGNCSNCGVEKFCYHQEWEMVTTKLYGKMEENPIDQMNLTKIFDFI